MRYKIALSYFGEDFHGWQRQPNATSVQQTIEDAFAVIFKDSFNLVGCGRTDTGVHARNFIAHFDSENTYNSNIINKLNSYLPDSIAIHDINKTTNNFHARFDAKSRTYEYNINTLKNPFATRYSWYIPQAINVDKMNDIAQTLQEYTDFTSFSKLHTDVKTNNCSIKQAFFREENNLLIFKITADRFLRNMVRAIVGTLILAGKNKIDKNDFKNIIEAKNRNKAGQSAPAKGLFLDNIEY